MSRRILCLLLLCVCLGPTPVARASEPELPTRDTFSLGYARLQSALSAGTPVSWSMGALPTALAGYEGGAAAALTALMGEITFSGVVQCLKEGGGWLEGAMYAGEGEVASLGQMAKDGRVALKLDGEWISVTQGAEAQLVSMLSLDGLWDALLALDYGELMAADTPFLTSLRRQGMRLWALASPYAEENNRLRVSSGATSHGLTYTIDTQAAREILGQWAEELTCEGLSLGLPGTAFSLGVSEEAFGAFVEKIRGLAGSVTLAKPITVNMAFGEGDLLRSAKGSGTLQEGNRRTNIAYTYSCSLSNTRVTHKYSLDFQPREGDTIRLTVTLLTSSNNRKSGAEEVHIDARGTYDGQAYRLKLSSEMVNRYALDEDGWLSEDITGDFSVSLQYAGETVLDLSAERQAVTRSGVGKDGMDITDTYDLRVAGGEGLLFAGTVTLSFAVFDPPLIPPSMEASAQLESMDFIEIEGLRGALAGSAGDFRRRFAAALPLSALEALIDASP